MKRLNVGLACAVIFAIHLLDAAETVAATLVDSTFLGGDFAHLYSTAANWSPAEVPNNTGSKTYNITIPSPSQYVNVDMDATVQNLTVAGQGLDLLGHSYTVNGTTAVAPDASVESSGALLIKGSLSNFDPTSKTLSGGRYSVFAANGSSASLSFPSADIVNNAASISLLAASSTITDAVGQNALRNFAHNLPGGSFAVVARDYPIGNAFTNDGLLTVGIDVAQWLPPVGASLTMNRLTNYDSASNRLAGGSYDVIASAGPGSGFPGVPAKLIVAGADIRRNAASITLEVSGSGLSAYDPSFTDENGNNALRNLAENEPAGVFQLKYLAETFQTNSDFTNSGSVLLQMSSLSLPASHVYRQNRGGTTLAGGIVTGDVEIQGGGFFAIDELNRAYTASQTPAINGNLAVGDALLDPIALRVNGSVLLSDTTRFWVEARPSFKGITVQSTLSLAGTLEIKSGSNSTIAHAASISGVFKNAPNGARVSTIDGRGSWLVTYTSTDVTLSNYQATAPNPRLLNISSRAQVLTGDQVAIAGFIVSGTDAKNVVIRAIGPSLAQAGLTAPLQDPVLELHDSKGGIIAANDNWQDTQSRELSSTGLAPTEPRESAIFVALPPGVYTAILRGTNNTTGVAVIEAYDLSSGLPSKLANISTRAFVDADHVLIGGFIAGGNTGDSVHVVVRAIGRGLEASGVQNFLPDATLEVRDKDGALVAANDDFSTPADNAATVPSSLRPPTLTDAATGFSVRPANYTVIVRGKNGGSGDALVEIYDPGS